LGFYDPVTKKLYVRGVGGTPYARYVMVHELTHALQDQRFGINLAGKNDDQLLGAKAVLEGDAMRTEKAYLSTRTGAEADVIEKEAYHAGDDVYAGFGDEAFYNFQYVIGKKFVDWLLA